MELVESLKADIAGGRCLLLVGTGFTTAVTNDPAASWLGFLTSGVARAKGLNVLSTGDQKKLDSWLTSDSDAEELLLAAAKIVTALGGSIGGEFSSWLREDIGYLSRRMENPGLVDALGALNLPILTTNYDDVLSKRLGRDYVTWRDLAQFQRVMNRQSDDVLHLHGHWKQPQSVVLTQEQYEQMLADAQLSALREAMVATNSLIFVGFGEGLSDPNFGRLRRWIQQTLPFQELRHYRLCREGDLAALSEAHRDEQIWPVSYGPDYADLEGFLRGLAPSSRVPVANLSPFELIEDQVRERAVLATYIPGAEDARISDLLVPPVLLPVPNEEFVAAAARRGGTLSMKRCDLKDEITSTHTVIAGDEYSGVTTALLWLCGDMYLSAASNLVPIVLDYRRLSSGFTPLRKQVVKELRRLGHSLGPDDELPDLLLVLDNVNTVKAGRLERVCKELTEPHYKRVLVGCRTGSETQIMSYLGAQELGFRLRYIGRLARADLRELASLVDKGRAKELTKSAALVVEQHGLPSTPFTLSMIISALLRGESLMAASSPTSLLDAYIDLLLGRGTAVDDSRFGLDSVNKSHILARLAELYVRQRVGALSEIDVYTELAKTLDEYGWNGQASEILADFKSRRILVARDRDVEFAQSSYLFLFAAKRARSSSKFLALLKAEPLYFSPILAHYAALERNDFGLVEDLVPGLLQPFLELNIGPSRLFVEDQNAGDAPDDPTDAELDERFRREAAATPEDEEDEGSDFLPLDGFARDRDIPFPLEPVDDEVTVARAVSTLGLASNLLRDTDIVEDQATRRRLFGDILSTYSKLVAMIEADEFYRVQARDVAEEMGKMFGVRGRKFEKFAEDLITVLPLVLAFAGVSGTLSSGKFARLIEASLDDDEFSARPDLLILANHVMFDVQARDWTRTLEVLGTKHPSILAVRLIVRNLAFFSYVRKPQAPADERRLQDFLVAQALLKAKGTVPELSERKSRAIESLKRARLLASKGELSMDAPGVLGGPDDEDDE